MPQSSSTGSIPARVSFVTLAVRDLPAMAAFYRQFRWPESAQSDEHTAMFQTGGAILGLYGAEHYQPDFGSPPAAGAFKGFTLAINLESPQAVDAAYEELQGFEGIRIQGPPADLSFGGRGFVFVDPEDNVWDVIWVDGTSFDERGGMIFP